MLEFGFQLNSLVFTYSVDDTDVKFSLRLGQLALDFREHNCYVNRGLPVYSVGRWDDGEWLGKDVVVAQFEIFPLFAWNN